jgi:hypothetical protein
VPSDRGENHEPGQAGSPFRCGASTFISLTIVVGMAGALNRDGIVKLAAGWVV